MKKTLLFFTLITLMSPLYSQSMLVQDSTIAFYLKTNIQRINETLWDAGAKNKITTYRNDSLKNPTEQMRYDSLRGTDQLFNKKKDFTGIGFTYFSTWNLEKASNDYSLIAVSPMFKFHVDGMELPSAPLFYVKLTDLNKVFNKNDVHFIKSLAMQRTLAGDFNYPYGSNNFDDTEGIFNMLTAKTHWNHTSIESLLNIYIEAHGKYTHYLISNMMGALNHNKKPLYKDKEMSISYKDIEYDLGYLYEHIDISVERNGKMVIVDTSAIEPFSFYKTYVFKIHKIEKDYLIEIITADTNEKPASIFYKYASAKHYLQPFDRIILESLFKDMLKSENSSSE